ncbi:MAG: S-layer homology domain-containing protein [Peptococcaceae bacterium]|nr:S-layer homology domain-containing protein [Peptococcaceae bacterium]
MNIILKKSLALVLAIVMIVGLFPHALYAGEADAGENTVSATLTPADTSDENMTLSKTAVRTGEDTWDVTLTVTPKDHAVKPVPSEVILVLDHSASMRDNKINGKTRWEILKNVLIEQDGLIESLDNLNARVTVMTFGDKNNVKRLNNGEFYNLGTPDELEKIKADINAIPMPNEDTYMQFAFAEIRTLLEKLPAGGRPEVIFLTDGVNLTDVRSNNSEIVTMRENIAYIKDKAELYGVSFDNKAKGDADMRYLLGAENVYTSDDYAGLKKNFEDISIKIRALITDPMSEWVTCTSQPTVEVSGANGETYPPAVLKDEYVSWTPEPGQEIAPGQTVTIKYSVKLKADQLKTLSENGGALPLNGTAKVNYLVDGAGGDPHNLLFPLPQDEVKVNKLITTDYLNGEPEGEPVIDYAIAYDGKTQLLALPEENAVKEKNGSQYTYENSTHDGNPVAAGDSVPVSEGEHHLNHYYYDANGRGSLVYHAGSGVFSDQTHEASVTGLAPGSYPLWTKDGQGRVPNGAAGWPTHDNQEGSAVVMVGWTSDPAAADKIYAQNEQLPALAANATISAGASTDVYAVWAYDKNGDGIPDQGQYFVNFAVADGHGTVMPEMIAVPAGSQLGAALNQSAPQISAEEGWHFIGQWLRKDGDGTALTDEALLTETINNNVIYIAQMEKVQPSEYAVAVNDSYADTTGAGSYAEGMVVTIDAGQRPGYRFTGWQSDDPELTLADAAHSTTTFTMPGHDVTLTATWQKKPTPPPVDPKDDGTPHDLNTEDHFSYVVGYPVDHRTGLATDDVDLWPVRPEAGITRAEVATIFYRLLKEDVRDRVTSDVNDFSDVASGDWFNVTVSSLAQMGVIAGYEDGSFRPNAPITRAEFAAIATRFFAERGVTYNEGLFADITGDEWFADVVAAAADRGLLGGYPDGTVRPNTTITRAESCAVVNRTLDRRPDAKHLLPAGEMRVWPDNPVDGWYYADMQEATNGHEYRWLTIGKNKIEDWTAILPDNTWNGR